jgi:hypothetical protein
LHTHANIQPSHLSPIRVSASPPMAPLPSSVDHHPQPRNRGVSHKTWPQQGIDTPGSQFITTDTVCNHGATTRSSGPGASVTNTSLLVWRCASLTTTFQRHIAPVLASLGHHCQLTRILLDSYPDTGLWGCGDTYAMFLADRDFDSSTHSHRRSQPFPALSSIAGTRGALVVFITHI